MVFFARVLVASLVLTLTSCKTVGGAKSFSSEASSANRSMEIHKQILEALKKDRKAEEGKTWSETRGSLDADWLIASPEGYWGKSAAEFPHNLACKPGESGCDKDFLRRLCSTDDDCRNQNTSCQLLEASANPTTPARKMCLGSGDQLLNRYYKVITSAEKHLEITSLSMPNGRFRTMLRNALAVLMVKPNPPSVRMLYSGSDVVNINITHPAQKYLRDFWYEVGHAAGRSDADLRSEDDRKAQKMKMNLAWLTDGTISWNHSKIVIADQARVVTGGHNLWDPDYVSDQPIADLSMEITGSAAKASQAYVNTLWSKVDSESLASQVGTWSYGELPQRKYPPLPFQKGYRINPPDLKDGQGGEIPMIAIGRLGKLGANSSDTAILAMIQSAQKSLDFAIQDLYQSPTGGAVIQLRPWILDALSDAVLRGVHLRVVKSDQKASLNGYTMVDYKKTFSLLVGDIQKAAAARRLSEKDGQSIRDFICSKIEMAPWRFTAGVTKWTNGDGFGSHPKLVIVDDSLFLIGSQNFYPSNLQEFGIIVSDADAVDELRKEYWNPLWEASSGEIARCP